MFIAPSHDFDNFKHRDSKKSTGRSIGSWLSFIVHSIRGISARKTQLLLVLKNNGKKIKQWSSHLHTTLTSFSLETQKNLTDRSI